MKSTGNVCEYCGEPSKWGYYNIDGMKICDECGDFVRSAESESGSRIKTVMRTRGGNKHPQHLAVEPVLLREVHHPGDDLGIRRAGIKVDIVVNIIGIEDKDVAANLIGTHSRLHPLLEVFRKLFSVCHKWCGGFLNSSTNVKVHTPLPARADVETEVKP